MRNLVTITTATNQVTTTEMSNNEKYSLTLFSSIDRANQYLQSYNVKEDVRNRYSLPISKQQLKECKAGEVLGYDLKGNLYTLTEYTLSR